MLVQCSRVSSYMILIEYVGQQTRLVYIPRVQPIDKMSTFRYEFAPGDTTSAEVFMCAVRNVVQPLSEVRNKRESGVHRRLPAVPLFFYIRGRI